jgi:uncharacterized membrane protein
MENLGKIIIGLGVILIIIGLVIWFFGGKLGWLGHLPGDIRVERSGFRFYAPITTMIIVSIVLSILLSLINRFFNR